MPQNVAPAELLHLCTVPRSHKPGEIRKCEVCGVPIHGEMPADGNAFTPHRGIYAASPVACNKRRAV